MVGKIIGIVDYNRLSSLNVNQRLVVSVGRIGVGDLVAFAGEAADNNGQQFIGSVAYYEMFRRRAEYAGQFSAQTQGTRIWV